jgi:hypothetical protein
VPLKPAQLASLALRVVAARHLDAELLGDEDGRNLLDSARGQVGAFVLGAGYRVKTDDAIAPYLSRAASDLASLLDDQSAADEPKGMIRDAALTLETMAADMGDHITAGGCEFVNVTSLIEMRALHTYETTGAVTGEAPPIRYETEVVEDAQGVLKPFRVAGSADITLSPRIVRLTVKDDDLTAVDLCQLAYVLHHELICHAFQTVGATCQRNAPPQCHWTEGWMDRLAFAMAEQWAEHNNAPHAWLPLTGPDAMGAMRLFHESRFLSPKGLKQADAKNRRAARHAFHALSKALVDNSMASSLGDAENLVCRFSLVANAHPAADLVTLRRICLHLQNNLLSPARRAQTGAVALACLDFLSHRDLSVLESDLSRDPYQRTLRPS